MITPAIHDLFIVTDVTWNPITLTFKDSSDVAVSIVSAWAEVRKTSLSPLMFNLSPEVTNPAGGEITFDFTDAELAVLPLGTFYWDIMLDTGVGGRTGPYLTGKIQISRKITHNHD